MKEKKQTSSEPSWLDPCNDRRTPFSDAELDVLVDDFMPGWQTHKLGRISSPKLASSEPETW